jgi:hypothetical protein
MIRLRHSGGRVFLRYDVALGGEVMQEVQEKVPNC